MKNFNIRYLNFICIFYHRNNYLLRKYNWKKIPRRILFSQKLITFVPSSFFFLHFLEKLGEQIKLKNSKLTYIVRTYLPSVFLIYHPNKCYLSEKLHNNLKQIINSQNIILIICVQNWYILVFLPKNLTYYVFITFTNFSTKQTTKTRELKFQ